LEADIRNLRELMSDQEGYKATSAKMAAPQRQFAGIPELVARVAEDVINRTSLQSLCLTNRFFNTIFTPVLYSEILFRANNSRFLLEDLQVILKNEALRHVRALDISVETNLSDSAICQLYNEGVQAILVQMPNLISFRYV
jgi:hypothetical protein